MNSLGSPKNVNFATLDDSEDHIQFQHTTDPDEIINIGTTETDQMTDEMKNQFQMGGGMSNDQGLGIFTSVNLDSSLPSNSKVKK